MKEGHEDRGHPYRSALKEAGPYLTLGLELGFTMIAWSGIGYLLDRWLDTLPWLTLAGVSVGVASVFLQLARASRTATGKSGSNSSTNSPPNSRT